MISFLQPLALLGLLVAGIPPLLHLISRRQPPVIIFPALRYLSETERRQSRKLRLRNLLLLLLRMAVIALIALAASRPIVRIPLGDDHAPTAVAIIVDNSLSSGAVVEGAPVLESLTDRARTILDRTGPDDKLWLIFADGVPRRLSASQMRDELDTLVAWPLRLDLGDAVRAAVTAMTAEENDNDAREVVVLSDLQASAFSGASDATDRVLVWEPPPSLSDNRGLDSSWAEPPVWTHGGQVFTVIGGVGDVPGAVRLRVQNFETARTFGGPGDRVVLDGDVPAFGWHGAEVVLDPDELRGDDGRQVALYVAQAAAVTVEPGVGTFLHQAVAVLQAAGRARSGTDVRLSDRPQAGRVIVVPPADPTRIGVLNRALEQMNISWRFGELMEGEWALPENVFPNEDAVVNRRYRLEGSGQVIGRVGEEAWLVKEGDLVLVGSRFEPTWGSMGVSAGFIPFLDFLVNRVASSDVWIVNARPGEPVRLPEAATAVLTPQGPVPVTGGGQFIAPLDIGILFLQGAAGDTIGAIEINHDALESRLAPAGRELIRGSLGPNALVLDDAGMDRELFLGARRADLTGLLLVLAILTALTELGLATLGGGRQTEE